MLTVMPEPTVGEVLNIDNPVAPKKHSAFSVTAWLLFIPPVGIYFAWKDPALHYLIAIATLILGIANLVTGLSSIALIPVFKSVMKTVEGNFNQTTFVAEIVLIVILGLVQIILGFITYKKSRTNGALTTNTLIYLVVSMVVALILQTILAGTMFTYTLGPYYQTLNSLY